MICGDSFSQKITPPRLRVSLGLKLGLKLKVKSRSKLIYLITLAIVSFGTISPSNHANAALLDSVAIKSNLDPNAITITEVDIVFLYDQALIENFPKTKSRWYSMRRTLTRAEGDSMDVVSVFIPQGFDAESAVLPERRLDAVKVYVFGQHDDGGVKPVDVTDFSSILVTIDDLGIIVTNRE
jgi:hypothetical protein